MPRSLRLASALLLTALAASGCDSEGPEADGVVTQLTVVRDPGGSAPLSAIATLRTTEPVSVSVRVEGQGGAGTDVAYRVPGADDVQSVPILGLYPGATTSVTLTLSDASGATVDERTVEVAAPALPSDFPSIAIDVPAGASAAPGMTLVSYFGHDSELTPQRAFIFDRAGAIRWALDFTGHPVLGGLFFDNGIERLANGNLYFGDRGSNTIYEVDFTGRILNTWGMPGYGFHHQVLELPSGNFLATVDRNGAPTVEDGVVEIDRGGGGVVRAWDLTQSLDAGRRAWPTDIADLDVDWFHGNGIARDPSDGGILVSGRTQGLVKLTPSNRVVWILAPHRGWDRAGDGTDLATKLLQPLDAQGAPITDPAVLDGSQRHPDFEWAWYQHSPKVLPDGTVMVFDNGDNRSYGAGGTYSRAVIYRIDEQAMTIQQVWEYGRERGAETYSRIVSEADYLADQDHVLFSPGAANVGRPVGKTVEVDRATRSVVFEATITPPVAPFGITLHRAERLTLAPADAQR